MTPCNETSQDVEVADGNGGKHTIKVVIPRTKLHNTQFWGIIAGMISTGAIVAALLGAFFMSKTEAAIVHGVINQKVGEHVVADDLRDETAATTTAETAKAINDRLAVQAEALDAIGDNVELLMAVDKIKWKAKPMPTGLTMPMPGGDGSP